MQAAFAIPSDDRIRRRLDDRRLPLDEQSPRRGTEHSLGEDRRSEFPEEGKTDVSSDTQVMHTETVDNSRKIRLYRSGVSERRIGKTGVSEVKEETRRCPARCVS